MTKEQLTALLALRVMGWCVQPDRFVMGNRGWMPRWRFQPTEKLVDAFRLLEEAAPAEYSIRGGSNGACEVKVRIGKTTGRASGASKPRAITLAVARALGIEVNSPA